jgi:hypothetical protein
MRYLLTFNIKSRDSHPHPTNEKPDQSPDHKRPAVCHPLPQASRESLVKGVGGSSRHWTPRHQALVSCANNNQTKFELTFVHQNKIVIGTLKKIILVKRTQQK